jgi:hypothetical protein
MKPNEMTSAAIVPTPPGSTPLLAKPLSYGQLLLVQIFLTHLTFLPEQPPSGQ